MQVTTIFVLAALTLSAAIAGAQETEMIRLTFTLGADGSVKLDSINPQVSIPVDKAAEGNFRFIVYDRDGITLYETARNARFFYNDISVNVSSISHSELIPYDERIAGIRVYFEGKLALDQKLTLCNHDNACDDFESQFSCTDCQAEKPDRLCMPEQNGMCDPDCLEGYDPDCSVQAAGQKEGRGVMPVELIAFFAALAAALVLIIRRRRARDEGYTA